MPLNLSPATGRHASPPHLQSGWIPPPDIATLRAMPERTQRSLAAIVSADMVGYSRLMGADEAGTLRRLNLHRAELIDPLVADLGGRIVKTTGDGLLLEFSSVVSAVECAIGVQEGLAARNAGMADDEAMRFRIGVHLGDVIVEGNDIFGDGVNIAARLQEIGEADGVTISRTAHENVAGRIDATFVDDGEHELKNIADPLRVWRWSVVKDAKPSPAGRDGEPLPLPDKPSIAVLPFDNMSRDPDQEYFSDGIVEGITATLSRIKTFFVIARTSAFIFKGKAATFQEVRDALGVRYFLEGSVQKAGDRVRITVQLIETTTGAHVWAEKYDGTLSDIFELQDAIIEQVAGAMHPSIRQAEIDRSRRKRPQDLDAYDFVMRAMPYVWSLEQEDNREALGLLTQAIDIDPSYPIALSLAAWCHGQRAVYNWSAMLDESKAEAMNLAKRAASLGGDDPLVLTVLGAAYTIINDHDSAETLLERAVSLDPNSARAWSRLGWSKVYSERTDEAIEHFETALRLSPHDPMNFNCHIGMACVYTILHDMPNAIQLFELSLKENPKAVWVHRNLAACYVVSGMMEKARAGVQLLLRAYPDLTAAKVKDAMVFSDAHMDWMCGNLIKAGLPE